MSTNGNTTVIDLHGEVENPSNWRLPQPKVIFEGTHLTDKTDIAFEFSESPLIVGERKHRWHIPLVSSEWETISEGPPTRLDPGHSLITFDETTRPRAMAAFDAWVRLFEAQRDYYWVADRFHISTQVYRQAKGWSPVDFAWLERRLLQLGFVVVHLVRDPDSFAEARARRLRHSSNPRRYEDLQLFVDEQELFRSVIAASSLPSVEVDVTDGDFHRVVRDVVAHLETLGRMYG